MGSSGSGSLSDYSNPNSSAGGNSGGSSNVDRCNLAFATSLEEVSRCEYFKKIGIPPTGTDVFVAFNKIRLVIIDTTRGYEIGYLPTKYNYIKNCLDDGFAYRGTVRSNALKPFPSVFVDMTPH